MCHQYDCPLTKNVQVVLAASCNLTHKDYRPLFICSYWIYLPFIPAVWLQFKLSTEMTP